MMSSIIRQKMPFHGGFTVLARFWVYDRIHWICFLILLDRNRISKVKRQNFPNSGKGWGAELEILVGGGGGGRLPAEGNLRRDHFDDLNLFQSQ